MKYKYYSTQRPITPGAYPKPRNNPAMLIHNFGKREYVPEIERFAWGYVEYDKPLTDEDMDDYGFIQADSFIQKSIKIDAETLEIIEAEEGRSFSDKVRNMAAEYRKLKRDGVASKKVIHIQD